MDFILPDDCHEEHDSSWTVFSHHYTCFVCLGCIVEILEDTQKLCIQKKPALSELLRLLTCQSGDLLQLFRLEERIVWHLAEILLGTVKFQLNAIAFRMANSVLAILSKKGLKKNTQN